MAEAVQLPSMNNTNKYFCYQCNREVFLFQSSDILCPECSSDFIEEVPDDADDFEFDEEDDTDVDESELNLLNLLSVENLFRRVMGEGSESPRRVSSESNDERESQGSNGIEIQSAHSILQHLEDRMLRGQGERLRHVGDYLFGEDIDALSTMLLNESEIVGPPPLPKDQIKLLPLVTITKEDVDKEVQCTICMEDFVVREKAKNLPCCHFYHEKCITPWLERHATCPNCRKPVEILQSKNRRSQSCPRTEFSIRSSGDQRRSSESTSITGFFTSSANPFRFL